jgi:hypothetical protein
VLRFLVLAVCCLQTWAIYEAKQAAAEIEMTHEGVKRQLTPGW